MVIPGKIGLSVKFGTELVGKVGTVSICQSVDNHTSKMSKTNKYLEEDKLHKHVLGEPAVRVRAQPTNLRLSNNFRAFVGFENVGYNC